jgi:hypothetical protein
MMNHLSDMMVLLTFLSLGVAYIWLCVVVNRRKRAQQLVLEQRRTSTGARSINSRRAAMSADDLDKALRSEAAQRLAGQ